MNSIRASVFTSLAIIGGIMVLAGSILAFIPYVTIADSNCPERYPAGGAVPTGYGASYNLFKTNDLFISVTCPAGGNEVSFKLSSKDTGHRTVFYKNAFRWNGQRWVNITFTGTPVPGASDWIEGDATLSVATRDLLPPDSYNYIAVHSCTLVSGSWKCGCRDTTCDEALWQLQSMKTPRPVVVGTSGGGGTTGYVTGGDGGGTTGAGGGGAGSYNYVFQPPSDINLSDSNVVVRHVNANGSFDSSEGPVDPGDWNKILLVVAPNEPLTKGVNVPGFIKARGVFLIGAAVRKTGTGTSATLGCRPGANTPCNEAPGGGIFDVKFTRGATTRPFVWVSNIDFDIVNSYWGDFLNVGVAGTNFDTWMDTYMQKIKIRRGHYFWTDPTCDNPCAQQPHSDIFQEKHEGSRAVYAANMDIRWSGQFFFMKPSRGTLHPNARLELAEIVFRPMPSNTYLFGNGGGGGWMRVVSAGNDLAEEGYTSVWFRNVYIEENPGQDRFSYVSLHSPSRTSVSGNTASFTGGGDADRPIADGEKKVTFGTPPSPVVSDDEVGYGARVDSAAKLRSIFNR